MSVGQKIRLQVEAEIVALGPIAVFTIFLGFAAMAALFAASVIAGLMSVAALCGVSPVDASCGRHHRHRLNRSGNRDANRALWVVALVRLRCDPRTREYAERRTKQGLSKPEILRCLRDRLHRTRWNVYAKRPFGGAEQAIRYLGRYIEAVEGDEPGPGLRGAMQRAPARPRAPAPRRPPFHVVRPSLVVGLRVICHVGRFGKSYIMSIVVDHL